MLKLLKQLWALAEREGIRTGTDPDSIFDPLGLCFFQNLSLGDPKHKYECTPINCSTFAGTGGEGVHFSLIFVGGAVTDESPIVMTVPPNHGNENLIVGANLYEFLCLGCVTGYFDLEKLVYWWRTEVIYDMTHPQEYRALYEKDVPEAFARDQALLGLLINEFDLKPWANVEARLAELQSQYMPMLELRDEE